MIHVLLDLGANTQLVDINGENLLFKLVRFTCKMKQLFSDEHRAVFARLRAMYLEVDVDAVNSQHEVIVVALFSL